jgi:hypothetical protein
MWKRATWHECADELNQICQRFRVAYWGKATGATGWPRDPRDETQMRESSRDGVQLLRALALAVRSEQDFEILPVGSDLVGAIKRDNAKPTDARDVKVAGGFSAMIGTVGYAPLGLRDSLNKIAHADPRSADYYVAPDERAHDLLLYGEHRGRSWFAALSLLEFITVIRRLPDANIVEGRQPSPDDGQ